MTVSPTPARSGPYFGNGVTKTFDFGFCVFKGDHLKVIRIINNDYEIVNPGHYSVFISPDTQSGTITFTTAPSIGEQITILRNAPFQQDLNLQNQGAYYAEDVERAFDLATMRDQQLCEELNRTVKAPAGFEGVSLDQLTVKIIRLSQSADNIDTLAPITNAIDTVSSVASDIVSVADIAPQVPAILDAHQWAHQWASAPVEHLVDDDINPIGFSAYHWAQKAQTIVGLDPNTKLDKSGGTITGDLTIDGSLRAPNIYTKTQSDDHFLSLLGGGSVSGDVEIWGTLTTFWDLRVGMSAALQLNGDVKGSVWQQWGHQWAFPAIHDRIEDRINVRCVTDVRLAGEWASGGNPWHGNRYAPAGYVLIALYKNGKHNVEAGIFKQLQINIPNIGWRAVANA
ncbi:MAG: hypothetical protein JSC189_001037 [Candidatus Tokpelaia sp. JSC189]|nr:MAG: hypothetical protein JSC189_001037 [Candidatus Tokpelaia sp. JSC189]